MPTNESASIRCPNHEKCHCLQPMFSPMGATPAPLSAPLCDDTASINLDDDPLDCQARQGHPEGIGFPMRCLELRDTKHFPRPKTSVTANKAVGIDEEPASDPAFSRNPASLQPCAKETSLPTKFCHRWLGSLLGLGSLILAIVCLLMFTVRSYRMAVWTTRNDELQACIGLIQVCNMSHPNVAR